MIRINNGTEISGTITFKPMIRLSTVADDTFQPYSNICPITGHTGLNVYVSPTQDIADATVYPISWNTEAGTVYGGTLDVTTGLLTVNTQGTSLTGGFVAAGNGTFYQEAVFTSLPPTTASVFESSYFETKNTNASDGTAEAILTPEKLCFQIIGANVRIMVYTTAFASVSDFNTALSTKPLDIVLSLATPQTYQLTRQQVNSLLGQDNVWHDANGDTSVEYYADTALYIEKKITAAIAAALNS